MNNSPATENHWPEVAYELPGAYTVFKDGHILHHEKQCAHRLSEAAEPLRQFLDGLTKRK